MSVSFALPTKGDSEPCLLDTSAALAFVQPSHAAHVTTYAALVDRPKGLDGHAAFETFSVLTRLPPPDRLTPQAAQRLIEVNFPHTRFLSSERSAALVAQLAASGVSGGAHECVIHGAARDTARGQLGNQSSRPLGAEETGVREVGLDLSLIHI